MNRPNENNLIFTAIKAIISTASHYNVQRHQHRHHHIAYNNRVQQPQLQQQQHQRRHGRHGPQKPKQEYEQRRGHHVHLQPKQEINQIQQQQPPRHQRRGRRGRQHHRRAAAPPSTKSNRKPKLIISCPLTKTYRGTVTQLIAEKRNVALADKTHINRKLSTLKQHFQRYMKDPTAANRETLQQLIAYNGNNVNQPLDDQQQKVIANNGNNNTHKMDCIEAKMNIVSTKEISADQQLLTAVELNNNVQKMDCDEATNNIDSKTADQLLNQNIAHLSLCNDNVLVESTATSLLTSINNMNMNDLREKSRFWSI